MGTDGEAHRSSYKGFVGNVSFGPSISSCYFNSDSAGVTDSGSMDVVGLIDNEFKSGNTVNFDPSSLEDWSDSTIWRFSYGSYPSLISPAP
jgi:hypothetical protein